MSRHNLSLKLVGNATIAEFSERESIINESVEWLSSLYTFCQTYNVSLNQIKAIDKTYLCTSPWHKHVRHIGPKGSIKSRKLTSSRGKGRLIIIFIISFFTYYYSDIFLLLTKFGQLYVGMAKLDLFSSKLQRKI
jgi:hypothetical protein